METVIKLQDVCLEFSVSEGFMKSFRHTALDNINLDIYKGENLGVIGKNGSGKSSLLQVLAGLISPTSGTLTLPSGEQTRSLLTLGLGFRPDLSGSDNALISLVLQGQTRSAARSMLPQIEAFSELGEFFAQPVRTYSSGMRARLGFATAICSEVDVMLIDEVLSVGDAGFRQKAEEVMLERIGGDQTVVFVSQSPAQIRKLCDRAIWIHESKISEVGTSGDVAKSYLQFLNLEQGT